MRVITIPLSDQARWEDYLQRSPRTVAWQSYHWSEALRRNYDVEFFALAVEEEKTGTLQGILPLYQLRGAKAPRRLFSVPFAVAGGMTSDSPEAEQALLAAAIELARERGADGITFKQYRYPIAGALRRDTNFFNRELALTAGEPALHANLRDTNRAAIERAEAFPLTLEYPSTRLEVFYDLLLGSMTRAGMPCPSRAWIATLLDLKMYSIALMEQGGRPIAGTMVKTFKTTVSFPFTCLCDRSPTTLDTTFALYWRLIRHFAGEGFAIFHSGRMPQSEDVEAYRLGWGGEKHAYFYQYYPNTEGQSEFRSKRGWKRQLFTACWKRMPKRLAGALGPGIVAKFP